MRTTTRLSARIGLALTAAALGTTSLVTLAPGATAAGATVERYVVLYKDGANLQQARKAVRAVGGKILKENLAARVAVVETRSASFRIDAGRQGTLAGVARDRYIGYAPPAPAASPTSAAARSSVRGSGTSKAQRQSGRDLERSGGAGSTTVVQRSTASTGTVGTEPLADRQWDMQMLHTTEAQRQQPGDRRVLVGVIDTGVDGSHPDIAPNFDRALSRNFVRDIPVDPAGNDLDGPCEYASCVDPVDHDDDGHGTHVASTIASPVNGVGIAGVAPDVRIVNIRAGQDSGYFFLAPTLDAITYAGDAGIDVVNMSFYTDPWLFNCTANPADSPAEQEEQRVIATATQRAVDYAYARGVTLVSAAGNENTDLSKPSVDESSPDYPQSLKDKPDYTHPRQIDPKSCVSVPTQSKHVISVSSLGPSTRMSFFSNYGTGQIDVAAPGGDSRDTALPSPQNRVLAAVPLNVLQAEEKLDADGNPTTASVVRDPRNPGAYYQYLQGTSMASPHAAGVAALIVSEFGHAGPRGSFGLSPDVVQAVLQGTATEHDCPEPAHVVYSGSGGYEATCEGGLKYNGFYGHGIVDAQAAVNAD